MYTQTQVQSCRKTIFPFHFLLHKRSWFIDETYNGLHMRNHDLYEYLTHNGRSNNLVWSTSKQQRPKYPAFKLFISKHSKTAESIILSPISIHWEHDALFCSFSTLPLCNVGFQLKEFRYKPKITRD